MSASQLPYISVEHVQASLDRLIYTAQPPQANPLERLFIVERVLLDPAAPRSALARELVLNDILITAIRELFVGVRRLHGLPDSNTNDPLPAALESIRQDGMTSSPDLIGWSILFYRYVTVGLNLSVERLADEFAVDARTVRRYQRRALRQLARRLIQLEWAARRTQRQIRLRAALPSQVRRHRVGHASARTALDRLYEGQSPRHFAVCGPHGIGKTALVENFGHDLIDRDALDHVIWIDRPSSIDLILQTVMDGIAPPERQGTLQEYLQLLRVLVVLDDVDALVGSDDGDLSRLLASLSAADVVLIGTGENLATNVAQVTVPELTEDETVELTEWFLSGSDEARDEIHAFGHHIWQAVGGNPLLIRLATAGNQFVETLTATSDAVLDRVYGQSLDALNRAQKRAWLMLALCPPGDIRLAQLEALWPSEMSSAAIESLIARSLLELVSREHGTVVMAAAARRFIQGRLAVEHELQLLAADLLRQLDWQTETTPILRDTLLYLLQKSWLSLAPKLSQRMLHRLADVYMPVPMRSQWRAILEIESGQADTADVRLRTAYAVCLRQSSQWETAITVLTDLIRQTGTQGQFLEQAQAMLELSVIYRYQSDYVHGASLLAKAEKTGRRFRDSALMQRARLELAQIEVDRSDGAAALRLLENMPSSVRTLALTGEAYMLDGDTARAGEILDQALALPDLDDETQARLQSVRGRIFEVAGLLDTARDCLTVAVTLLEQGNDLFGLARARSNLAALLIRLDQRSGVAELLRRAEAVQRVLGDRVGLMATRHNLRLLHIRSSR